jgi:hypothetical protein
MILRQSPRFPGVVDRMGRNGCSVLRRTRKERNRVPVGTPPSSAGLFSGPFAVRRLGRRCDAEGDVANRCLSEAITDVRASCDSRPRREAAPSAAARAARRLFPSPFWPVKKGTSRRVIPGGSLQQNRSSHTCFYQFTWCKLSERIRIRTGGAQINRCKIGPAPRTRLETPSTLSKMWPIALATIPFRPRAGISHPTTNDARPKVNPLRCAPSLQERWERSPPMGPPARSAPPPQRPTRERPTLNRPTHNVQRPNAKNPQPSPQNPQPETQTAHPPGVVSSAAVQVLLLRSTSGK